MFDHKKKTPEFFKSSEMKPKTPKKEAYKYSLFCHILPPSRDVVSTAKSRDPSPTIGLPQKKHIPQIWVGFKFK